MRRLRSVEAPPPERSPEEWALRAVLLTYQEPADRLVELRRWIEGHAQPETIAALAGAWQMGGALAVEAMVRGLGIALPAGFADGAKLYARIRPDSPRERHVVMRGDDAFLFERAVWYAVPFDLAKTLRLERDHCDAPEPVYGYDEHLGRLAQHPYARVKPSAETFEITATPPGFAPDEVRPFGERFRL